ncbi:anaphase-promoting complex subunit Cdc16p [[Candida] railenensis]|uniref:Anaphase-promoting complex subunit Cdc16p n=1 Tax=[Candida] railenensis TaxID=45579 RepID=A0A9P0QRH2_9ASCO|nr:anaphase-promoting complex subunit Cdc16p [[Candida] railenensis]
MVTQKTPSQHNSTLYISPLITNTRRPDLFVTPPNPPNSVFDTPGSNHSSFFDNSYKQNQRNPNGPPQSQNQRHGGIAMENNAGAEKKPGVNDFVGEEEHSTKGDESNRHGVFSSDGSKQFEVAKEPLTQAEKLRLWRHDALMQHHYKTAEYIGNKVLALTDDPNDAFWLAQVYFNTGNYLRVKHLLSKYDKSVSCRYLAAYALVKLELWDDALDLVGETNPFVRDDFYQVRSTDGGIKLEASMCYLRGVIYANQNNFERAKESYKEAVLIDVKCFEAFEALISQNLMTPSEEWDFVMSLNYRNADDDNSDLVRLLYTTNLSKYLNASTFNEAEEILDEEYQLGDNCDILLAKADYLYVHCKFDECLAICERILTKDEYNFKIIPIYLSCLHELGGKNKLFLKAHQLAEQHSTQPVTWLAIGIYYLSINKVIEARKFFSKATLLNPNFGQAWIGFAHTFAAEGEHEQAISAYAFAARLFPGTHLPNLFLGMQHLQMSNLNLSEEYLLASYQICSTDPLLLNELAVINYHKNKLKQAESFCQDALSAAKYLNSDSKTWISIHTNMGHIFRRDNEPFKALECFQQVLKISNRDDSNILAAMGLIYLKLGDHLKAIDVLHDALAVSPGDPVASDLLKRALEANLENGMNYLKNNKSIESSLPTLQYRRNVSNAITEVKNNADISAASRSSKLEAKSRRSRDEETTEAELEANELKRGEISSEEEDEVMDIESD